MTKMEALIDRRCWWCGTDPLYTAYHDNEWGRLVTDDHTLFEFIVLESAQAGLSWLTILRRREGYRSAFHNFNVERVAAMTEEDIERLTHDERIIRHRRKIETTISNARHFIEVQREFGSFYNYIMSFFPGGVPIDNHPKSIADVPPTTPLSDTIAKDMKRRGFLFFGPAICYAFLQATGFVNDHIEGCRCRTTQP